MNAISALREQLGAAHWTFEATMADVTPEHFRWQPPATTNSIADNYLHAVCGEDEVVQGMLQHKPTLASTSWEGRSGLSSTPPGAHGSAGWVDWVRDVQVDLPAVRQYAQAVYAATDQYLAGLTEDDLDRTIDMSSSGLGTQTLNWVLFNFVIGHAADHMGEIAVLKGFQGLKGLPF